MRRLAPLLALFVVLLAPGAAAAPAPDPPIAAGVFAGGVDVGGLTVTQAAAKLQSTLGPGFARPLVVYIGKTRFALTARRAKVSFDALRTARRAFHFGIAHPPALTPAPPTGGSAPPVEGVPLAVRHSHVAVKALADKVAARAFVAPRDASVRYTVEHIFANHSRPGRGLNTKAFTTAADAALDDPGAHHLLVAPLRKTRPRVTVADLPKRYPTILTIDRDSFKLRLFKGLKWNRTYGIAVGMAGLETPAGLHSITNKQVDPTWHVPNSPWAGSLAGQSIPPGPANPLKARWLGIAAGVGIHGTAEDWSIGTRASHGCIRMHVPDVIALYPLVPVGTPVLIK